VQRGLPARLLIKYFEKVDDAWVLSPRIRQMVRWRRMNLLSDFRAAGPFDVIFCRNVLSSFDESTRKMVLDHLAQTLAEDGFLMLGLNEAVSGLTQASARCPAGAACTCAIPPTGRRRRDPLSGGATASRARRRGIPRNRLRRIGRSGLRRRKHQPRGDAAGLVRHDLGLPRNCRAKAIIRVRPTPSPITGGPTLEPSSEISRLASSPRTWKRTCSTPPAAKACLRALDRASTANRASGASLSGRWSARRPPGRS